MQHRGKWLFFFGERHSFDPYDTQWITLRSFWDEFLGQTSSKSRIAFVEGGVRTVPDNMGGAIEAHGGMGLLVYLANREGVAVLSPEPPGKYERQMLLKLFNPEQIQYFYFARVVRQWQRKQNIKPVFDAYIQRALDYDKRESEWKDFDFSLQAMMRLHLKYFGFNLDPCDSEFFRMITSSTTCEGWTNELARRSNAIRDQYIAAEIVKYLDQVSAFGSFGSNHVIAQAPLLQRALSAK